jgi:hypothetical protein
LPLIYKPNSNYYSFEKKETLTMFYSYDCINYYYLDVFIEHNIDYLEQITMATNYPLTIDNKMFFYINNNNELSTYSLEKDRFFYLTNENVNDSAEIKLNLIKIDGAIMLDYKIENDGFIQVQLSDKNNNILQGYEYKNFENIMLNESFNYNLEWKNVSNIFNNEYYISIKFKNAKIFSIKFKEYL